jgi:predicted DNA binding CopG/RHH family protein
MSKRRAKPKTLPTFKSEDEERAFWATHDVVDYFDLSNSARATFPALKPSTTAISIRLPTSLLDEIKTLANKQDVPYQSLMKVYLAERIDRERRRKAG